MPFFQRQGFATEAVTGLLGWIFGHPHVPTICAQRFPALLPSMRVLEKAGFRLAGAGFEPDTVLYTRPRPRS